MAYPEATHSKFGVFSDLMVDIIYRLVFVALALRGSAEAS